MLGRVTSKNYMGGYTHSTLEVGGTELRVSKRNAISQSQRPEIGRKVWLGYRLSGLLPLGSSWGSP